MTVLHNTEVEIGKEVQNEQSEEVVVEIEMAKTMAETEREVIVMTGKESMIVIGGKIEVIHQPKTKIITIVVNMKGSRLSGQLDSYIHFSTIF